LEALIEDAELSLEIATKWLSDSGLEVNTNKTLLSQAKLEILK
jgi:hypothetical protein